MTLRGVLQVLDLAQGRLVLCLTQDRLLAVHIQLARSDCLAEGIACSARVRAGILRVGVHNIEGYEAEAVGFGES